MKKIFYFSLLFVLCFASCQKHKERQTHEPIIQTGQIEGMETLSMEDSSQAAKKELAWKQGMVESEGLIDSVLILHNLNQWYSRGKRLFIGDTLIGDEVYLNTRLSLRNGWHVDIALNKWNYRKSICKEGVSEETRIQMDSVIDSFSKISWLDSFPILPVYRFSGGKVGIVFPEGRRQAPNLWKYYKLFIQGWFSYSKGGIDGIHGYTGYKRIDLGRYSLHTFDSLKGLLLGNSKPSFYIISADSAYATEVDDVYLNHDFDGCRSEFFTLTFAHSDIVERHPPLFAFRNPVDIEFGGNEKLTQAIWERDSMMDFEYRDKQKSIVIGRTDSLYLAYKGDLNRADSKTLFPTRYIATATDSSFTLEKEFSLDLYGVPCD